MMETKGILPNINSDSYQHIHDSPRGINITSQAEVELGDNSALLDDSADASNDTADKDMESLPEMLDDAITSKNGFSHDEKSDAEIESNDSMDIPKAIVETPLVPNTELSKNIKKSEDSIHTVDEDGLAAKAVQGDDIGNAKNQSNNKNVKSSYVLAESSDAAAETEAKENDTLEEGNEEITNVPNNDRDLEMEPKPTVSAINTTTPEIVDVEDSDEENDNSDEDDLKDEDSDDETGN